MYEIHSIRQYVIELYIFDHFKICECCTLYSQMYCALPFDVCCMSSLNASLLLTVGLLINFLEDITPLIAPTTEDMHIINE
jgi:hypothetical protein